ncbi:MAG: hypothetical protein LLG37_02890 [Spirochaetia bacterium]|nr:hypothetical protein [Spirochaetia bacterium]
MELSTRLFAMIIELVYVPVQIEDKKIRELFNSVSDNHSITSYNAAPDGTVVMSSKDEKNNFVRYRIMKDRVVLSYEYCRNSINYYQGLAGDFIEKFTKNIGVSLFLAETTVLRRHANIQGVSDSRDYLIKRVYGMDEENLKKFNRPLHMMGTRIFFPPVPDDPCVYEVKIETVMEDYRTLFLECLGVYAAAIDTRQGITGIFNNLKKTDDFLINNIGGFITQFAEEKQ